MKMFLSPAICLGGAAIGTATPLLTVDVTVPVTGGQVCTSTLPNLPVALLNPALTYVPGSTTLWACGRVPANWDIECFSLNLAAVNAWVPSLIQSRFDHPFSNFAFDNSLVPKLLSCPPYELGYAKQETFTVGTGWATVNYLPISPYKTSGLPGCLVVGDYLYMFGGRQPTSNGSVYAQRISLLGTVSTNTWELLLSNLPQGLTSPICVPNPTNKCQIFCASSYNQGSILQNCFAAIGFSVNYGYFHCGFVNS